MRKTRVVFFCGTLMQGGAERVISILTRQFTEMGMDTTILCYYDAEVFYKIHPNVKMVCVEKETGSRGILKNLLWTRSFFKKRADIIISFMASFNMYALVAHIGLKMPIIVSDRSDPHIVPSSLFMRKTRDFLYRSADGIVVQTKRNYDYFPRSVQRKSTVIFNPVDIDEHRKLALKTPKQKRIVSVGRLIRSKNQKLLIDAFAEIRQEYPDYTLTIYGEGDLREELVNYIDQLGLAEKVFLPGNEKEILKKIADAELFVLSSNYEGMPNALIEAMCIGLPVISTNVSGADDFIIDGENGILVDCCDLPQLTCAMRKMLADTAFREDSAKKASDIYGKVVPQKIAEEWIDLIMSKSL